MEDSIQKSRRRFLATAVLGAGGVALLNCTSQPDSCGDAGATVTVGDVPAGRWVRPLGMSYIIAHDSAGFYAYTAVCTHQGCIIGCPDSTGHSVCPCHGAQFDGNGHNVVPAQGLVHQADLDHFAVSFQGTGPSATIVVDTNTVADAAMRVQPPTA